MRSQAQRKRLNPRYMPERNIKLTIKYDGTNYAGWQFQENAKSIQETIERALRKITGEKVKLTSAGRTDSGVHARAQVANFKDTASGLPLKNIQKALNSFLPRDIVISAVEEAPFNFNSKTHARSKTYRYTIVRADFIDPLIRHFAVRCKYALNLAAMRREAKNLVGRHDFKSFQKARGEEKETVRTVKDIRIEKEKEMIYIDIEADGFLYNMARNIVGTLIEVGRGKFPQGITNRILLEKDRKLCGPTAPAKGLCLVRVRY